jgi:hypothetical protein
MTENIKSYPVAPDSVYVWRGFMAPPPRTYENFISFLGSIFVPACVKLQPKVGLRAYLPCLIPQKDKSSNLPDQTALMFWADKNAHSNANKSLAVRIYQSLHGDVYDMSKSKLPEVPVFFNESIQITSEQPYYLFENTADWMVGSTQHLLAGRPDTLTIPAFQELIKKWALQLQKNASIPVDASLVVVGNEYVAIWIHTPFEKSDLEKSLQGLQAQIPIHLLTNFANKAIPESLWNDWEGIDYTNSQNQAINFQFDRPENTNPIKL